MMNSHKLIIRYILEKSKIRRNGKAPLYGRITYLKKRKQFTTGLYINPNNWKSKIQEAYPPDKYKYINSQLSLISQKINEAFLFLQVNKVSFDVNDIYHKYCGNAISKDVSLLEVYDLHNTKMRKLIGVDFNETSWSRYLENRRKVKHFIERYYKSNDIPLKSLNIKFIRDLEYHFKTDLKLRQATINRSLQRVRKVINFAISENYLATDPFIFFKPTKYKNELVYLNNEELSNLKDYQFVQNRLAQVRDMFVFCCYTGLAYKEMSVLNKENLIIGFDGNTWIQIHRQKTNSIVSIPLLSIPKTIIKKYRNDESLLPIISNQKFNSYLKEIAQIIGINKRLTHHVARKTFATTVLLYNQIPIEVVSELLGHSKIEITQRYYAKVIKKSLSDHISSLDKKLKNM